MSVGHFDRSGLKRIAVVLAVVAAVNVAVGRVAVAVLWVDQAAVIPLLGVAGVLGIGYRAHSELRRRHGDLEQVYRFSRAVEGLVEADQVIHAVLSEAKRLLPEQAGRAGPCRDPTATRVYRLAADGPLVRSVEPGPHPLHRRWSVAEGAVLVPRATQRPGPGSRPCRHAGFVMRWPRPCSSTTASWARSWWRIV